MREPGRPGEIALGARTSRPLFYFGAPERPVDNAMRYRADADFQTKTSPPLTTTVWPVANPRRITNAADRQFGQARRFAAGSRLKYISGYTMRRSVGRNAQKRAIENYRSRLAKRGIVRFELQALASDRDLIRILARKLSDGGPEAGHLRGKVQQAVSGEPPKSGGILAALRRSPLVGTDLDLTRAREEGRRVDL